MPPARVCWCVCVTNCERSVHKPDFFPSRLRDSGKQPAEATKRNQDVPWLLLCRTVQNGKDMAESSLAMMDDSWARVAEAFEYTVREVPCVRHP